MNRGPREAVLRLRGERRRSGASDTQLAPALARLKGLEPLTHCLEGSCSIHLSYRRILGASRSSQSLLHKYPYASRENAPRLGGERRHGGVNELSRPKGSERYAACADVERVMGIEPTRPAWKAGILPLNYTRISGRSANISLDRIA